MKRALAFVSPLALIALACANQTTPMGGPKDEKPPVLVRSIPDSSQRNYHGTTIVLFFNEMLQLNNPKEEIIITPPVGKKTQFKLNDDRVTIEPEFPLKENTTYNINFREGIKDITEGNVAQDLYLAFSTGPELDSLIIHGTVKNALSQKIPENITVALYQSDTFDITQHTPDYFTKSNKEGAFRLRNLKAGTYNVYAFADKNKNLKVDTQSELFGIVATPVQLDSITPPISIALVRIDSRPLRFNSVRTQSTLNTIRLNKQVATYTIRSTHPILSTFGLDQSEIIAHYPDINKDTPRDSLLITLTATDSVEQTIDTTFYIRRDENQKIRETFRSGSTDIKFNAQTKAFEFSIKYNKPLREFTKDSLSILSDTATYIPLNIANIKVDTIRNQLTYKETLTQTDSLINPLLKIGKGFLISIDNDSSRAESKTIEVLTPSTTATLLVEVQTKEPHYIVEVVDANDQVITRSIDTPNPVFRFLAPQPVRIRVVKDSNGNGRWDTANYLKNQEPEEITYFINSEKKSDIPLRANWEVGPNVIKL